MQKLKLQLSLNKDNELKMIQEKAAEEREERRQKLSMSKKLNYDYKKANAEQKKIESNQLHEIAYKGKVYTEMEKRNKVEEEKKR